MDISYQLSILAKAITLLQNSMLSNKILSTILHSHSLIIYPTLSPINHLIPPIYYSLYTSTHYTPRHVPNISSNHAYPIILHSNHYYSSPSLSMSLNHVTPTPQKSRSHPNSHALSLSPYNSKMYYHPPYLTPVDDSHHSTIHIHIHIIPNLLLLIYFLIFMKTFTKN